MAIAGKVMPRPRGEYDNATVYDVIDIVLYENRPWICKKPNTVGIEPSESNPDNWMKLIDVDITDADTLGGNEPEYYLSKEELATVLSTKQIVFQASGWSAEAPYTQTVDWPEITENDSPIPLFVDDGTDESESSAKKKAFGFITYFDSANGSVTATCKYKRPEVDFTVGFKGVL